MNKHKGRLLLAGLAIAAFVWATSGASEAASRTVTLTVEKVQKMIVDTINSMVPGMIEDAIDARVEELSQAPAGGEEVYPVTNPTILTPVAGALNVMNFGAKGDGVTDDRAAIQAALNACDGAKMTTVYLPDGTYMVSMVSNGMVLAPKSNTKIQLAPNATIQLMPQTGATRVVYYGIIRTTASVTNLEICGGRIVGELDYQWYTNGRTNEQGCGIRVHDSSNIYIHDMAVDDCWGDGIIFTSPTTTGYCRDVEVARCTFDGAYRDNITANAILNGYFHDLQFKNGLQCFVDCEPNYVGNICYNVLFENCSGVHCERYHAYCYGLGAVYNGMVAGGVPTMPYKITFKNCTGTDLTTNPSYVGDELTNFYRGGHVSTWEAAYPAYFDCRWEETSIVDTGDEGGGGTPGEVSLLDEYPQANWDSTVGLNTTTAYIRGQAFSPDSNALLTSCKFYIRAEGSPTGNVVAELYAGTGTLGTNCVGTEAALATSTAVDASSISADAAMVEFTFDGTYEMVAGHNYVIVLNYPSGDAASFIRMYRDASSPTHEGNYVWSSGGTWSYTAAADFIFAVYGQVMT